jgi:guanine deaminase
MDNIQIIKGNFFDCSQDMELRARTGAYCVVKDGISEGIFDELPEKYAGAPVTDYGDMLIMPALVDLHTHAPQYTFHGMGMDLELLEWLNTYTFPEEARYRDLEYASQAYDIFVDALTRSGTGRAVIFGTIHTEATLLLMEKLEKSGLVTYVGKVNMDRNSSDNYREETEESLRETERFVEKAHSFRNTFPILTPRFIPTCSDELMRGLSAIQKRTGLPAQSHLSENRSEIEWVKELVPDAAFYGDAYDIFGLFGGECRTVMAHCVSSGKEEIERMAQKGVFVAHCPNSNTNISSGIAPVRKLLDAGIRVGLGSDVAGGHSLSLFDEMVSAVQVSNLRWRCIDQNDRQLSMTEVFYMATRGGGEFFGKVGSFDRGYEFDALVVDDCGLAGMIKPDPAHRFLRSLYLSHECLLAAKYVKGNKIL